jgi:phytoene dehydrogenase-like protein
MIDPYDAIAIGSGLGGLTVVPLYAKAAHRVLVLERNDNFGVAGCVVMLKLTQTDRSVSTSWMDLWDS